jgi:hypothetical protein
MPGVPREVEKHADGSAGRAQANRRHWRGHYGCKKSPPANSPTSPNQNQAECAAATPAPKLTRKDCHRKTGAELLARPPRRAVELVIMAKEKIVSKRAVATKPKVPLPPVPPGSVPQDFNPKGPGEQMDVVSAKDGWSEYTLDDGTVLRLKAALLDAKKAVGQYGTDGNPLYLFQFTIVNQVLVPPHLRKKS